MMGDLLRSEAASAELLAELEALRVSEARYRAMLAAVPDLIFRLSADFYYLDFHIPDMPGVFPPPEHFVGRHIAEALPPHLASLFVAATRRARATGELQRFEYQFPMATGPRDREARILPVAGSDETMVIVKDVTERKQAERRLRELVQSKDDFIATISHELRTPLTSVLGFATVLREAAGGLPLEEGEEMVRLIAEQAAELTTIVEDLLVAARSRVAQLQVDTLDVDLASELRTVLETTPQVAGLPIGLRIGEAHAAADPVRVRQILRNLLTNAVRYGGDEISVTVDLRGKTASVQVFDDGAGIPEGDREAIFERYHTSRSVNQPGAVGLGLTVSRDLARLMGGEVTYRRENGQSCFELTLPAS